MSLLNNWHTVPVVHLITPAVLLWGGVGYYVADFYKVSYAAKIVAVVIALVVMLIFADSWGIKDNLGSFLCIKGSMNGGDILPMPMPMPPARPGDIIT